MMSSPSFSLYNPLPTITTSFFTPHQTPPTSPLPPFSFSYLPRTPSPLRTSRNANLMPPTPTPTAPAKSSPLSDISNVWNSAENENENAFTFSPSVSNPFSTNNTIKKDTSFSRRSRSQSPITELSTRTSLARDRRKSLFLEQIRSKREDEKFEGRGDQVLRIDWARGEAERKGMLARQAMRVSSLHAEMEAEAYDDDVMREAEEGGISPAEDRELEEMIRLHEEGMGRDGTGGGEEDMMGDLDDVEYDQLFMEISASQEQQSHSVPQQQQQQQQQQVQQESGFNWAQRDSTFASGSAGIGGNSDEVMDMS